MTLPIKSSSAKLHDLMMSIEQRPPKEQTRIYRDAFFGVVDSMAKRIGDEDLNDELRIRLSCSALELSSAYTSDTKDEE